MAINGSCGSSGGGWSTGDSHDSGIGNSPPFEGIRGGISGMGGNTILSNGVAGTKVKTLSDFWIISLVKECIYLNDSCFAI